MKKEEKLRELKGLIDVEYFTEKELSARLKISVSKLQKDRVNGRGIPFVLIGKSVRYSSWHVYEYLIQNTHQSTSANSVGA